MTTGFLFTRARTTVAPVIGSVPASGGAGGSTRTVPLSGVGGPRLVAAREHDTAEEDSGRRRREGR